MIKRDLWRFLEFLAAVLVCALAYVGVRVLTEGCP